MNIRSHGPSDDPQRRLDLARAARRRVEQASDQLESAQEARSAEIKAAMARASRAREAQAEHVEAVREHAEALGPDRVELSAAAQKFVDEAADEAARVELVQRLRAAYEAGELNSRERIERAAERLLGAD